MPRRPPPVLTLAGALLAAAAALAPGLGAVARAQPGPDPLLAMGALRPARPIEAPRVSFRDLDGRPAGLEQFRGRPVLLTFFATW